MKERPTTDRAKEGLFNILENRFAFDRIQILDLFAGTGSISFEFCSRGARMVKAVERDKKLSTFIERTAEELGMEGLSVEKKDALRFLEESSTSFDLIFADPPYGNEELYPKIIERIRKEKLLNSGGCLILEHDERMNFEAENGFQEVRSFGNSHFSFFVL